MRDDELLSRGVSLAAVSLGTAAALGKSKQWIVGSCSDFGSHEVFTHFSWEF